MSASTIKNIMATYEQKRNNAFYNLAQRKEKIFNQIPRLRDIENEIKTCAIKSAKSILLAESNEKNSYVQSLEGNINILTKEKEALLKQANISLSDLEPKFECLKCNDTGYVNNQKCNCFIQQLINDLYNDSNLLNFNEQNFNNFNLNIFSDEVDKKYGISPRDNIKNIQKEAKNFIKNFNSSKQKNLFLFGPTGLGKTYLSSCIANELLKMQKTVLYQTAPILINSLIDEKINNKGNNKIYNEVFKVDLLIIDDLGVEFTNSMRFEELFTIINTRLINSKKTIISTNLNLDELQSKYDDRIVSRIIANYSLQKFIGEDIRIKNR